MFAQAGAFLKGFVKVAKNAAIRAVHDWAGKPVHSLMLEGVCVWTDDQLDSLWHWFRERFAGQRERREALEDFQNTPPRELIGQIEQELPDATPEERQLLLEIAEQIQANLLAQAEPANERGQSLLKSTVRVETKAQFTTLLTGLTATGPNPADGPVPLRPGDRLTERYCVVRLIGQGGMGTVYLAEDDALNESVALKTIRLDGSGDADTLLRRLRDETRLCRKLTHGHIVRVHDLNVDPARGLHYLTMEFVSGQPLARWLDARSRDHVPVTLDEFRILATALCQALEYAHTKGVLHNDIKPGNIMVGDDLRDIKLMDFGLARAIHRDTPSAARPVGFTVYYVAPEVLHGGEPDERSDLYALAVVFYETLAGRLPVAGTGLVTKRRTDIPAGIGEALAKAMEEEPADRFPNVQAFYEALQIAWNVPTAQPRTSTSLPPIATAVTPVVSSPQESQAIPPTTENSTHEPPSSLSLEKISTIETDAKENPLQPPPASPVSPQPNEPSRLLTFDLGGGVNLELVRIPAGEFLMGSPAAEEYRWPNEGPQRKVRISRPFYLGKYPVTIAQFRRFVQETGYRTRAEKNTWGGWLEKGGGYCWNEKAGDPVYNEKANWTNPGFAQEGQSPVVLVNMNDVEAFCSWLARKIGQAVRLPTEAEWEYACRSGTTTPFYFGQTISADQANYNGNHSYDGRQGPYRQKTTPVGSFPANAWGLHDMHGNVWERCQDWYEDYYYKGRPTPDTDPTGPPKTSIHVLRGGAWHSDPTRCRAAARHWIGNVARGNQTGFRIAVGSL